MTEAKWWEFQRLHDSEPGSLWIHTTTELKDKYKKWFKTKSAAGHGVWTGQYSTDSDKHTKVVFSDAIHKDLDGVVAYSSIRQPANILDWKGAVFKSVEHNQKVETSGAKVEWWRFYRRDRTNDGAIWIRATAVDATSYREIFCRNSHTFYVAFEQAPPDFVQGTKAIFSGYLSPRLKGVVAYSDLGPLQTLFHWDSSTFQSVQLHQAVTEVNAVAKKQWWSFKVPADGGHFTGRKKLWIETDDPQGLEDILNNSSNYDIEKKQEALPRGKLYEVTYHDVDHTFLTNSAKGWDVLEEEDGNTYEDPDDFCGLRVNTFCVRGESTMPGYAKEKTMGKTIAKVGNRVKNAAIRGGRKVLIDTYIEQLQGPIVNLLSDGVNSAGFRAGLSEFMATPRGRALICILHTFIVDLVPAGILPDEYKDVLRDALDEKAVVEVTGEVMKHLAEPLKALLAQKELLGLGAPAPAIEVKPVRTRAKAGASVSAE